MKKLALISFEFPPETAIGGIGSYFFNLCELLKSQDIEVHVFSATFKKDSHGTIYKSNCINHLIFSKTNDDFRKSIVSVFTEINKQVKFDIIESPEVGACALEIKKSFPEIPLIVKLHTPGVLISRINRTYQPLSQKIRFILGGMIKGRLDLGYWSKTDKNKQKDVEYQICLLANKLLSPSNALKKWIVEYWNINSEKIQIIPNPFIINQQQNANKTKREKVILFVGKLTVLKGMIAFTKAIPFILKKNPAYRIKLVGRDEYEPTLSKNMKTFMIEKLGSYLNRIDFLGVLDRSEVDLLFKSSEICVFPSLWENYPTVVLEAMANGCPVVASRVGGFIEIINHKKNGVLFNSLNYKDIVRTINKILKNPHLREKISLNEIETIKSMQNSSFLDPIIEPYLIL